MTSLNFKPLLLCTFLPLVLIMLTAAEQQKATACVSVLRPLNKATTSACCETYLTLSKVIPLRHCAHTLRENKLACEGSESAAFGKHLQLYLKTRFPCCEPDPHVLAAVLHPRFKEICFLTRTEKTHLHGDGDTYKLW